MTVRLLVAAGGTGGHVYPALAVAEAVREARPDARVHFVGGRRGIEKELVPRAGFPLTRLPAAGMRGLGLAGALRFAGAFVLALVASLFLILRLRPHLVLATGGYASAAPAVSAALTLRPLWLQEQNSVPGSTNRMLSRLAERAFVAFEEAQIYFSRVRTVVPMPNPVRTQIIDHRNDPATAEDFERFELSPDRPTVLLFGGSRGARSLNEAFAQAWTTIEAETSWQVLAQTGEADHQATYAAAKGERAQVVPYIHDMERAYRIADVVVCRAGALTLAELSVLAKPAILVPFPHATDDHQTRNAQAFVRAGAAVVIADAELTGDTLAAQLKRLAEDPARLEAMAKAARALTGDQDAARTIAGEIIARAESGVRA